MPHLLARSILLVLLLLGLAVPAHAATTAQDVQTSWRLLDYIAVDYREAVASGKVVNSLEYDEMVEFSANVSSRFAALPDKPAKAGLLGGAKQLEAAISAKQEPAAIARQAKALAGQLLATYPVPLAPSRVPDLKRGAALYAENCASCHGGKALVVDKGALPGPAALIPESGKQRLLSCLAGRVTPLTLLIITRSMFRQPESERG